MLNVGLDVVPHEHPLLVTEAPLTPPLVSRLLDEMIFEEFGFKAACRVPASYLAAVGLKEETECDTGGQLDPIIRKYSSVHRNFNVVVSSRYSSKSS